MTDWHTPCNRLFYSSAQGKFWPVYSTKFYQWEILAGLFDQILPELHDTLALKLFDGSGSNFDTFWGLLGAVVTRVVSVLRPSQLSGMQFLISKLMNL